ncbi:MAG: UDP-N-acetylglucosamine 2-epimerase [Marinobacter sp.]|nr:UDP-N-acetylglucosamine 2-epimerase [Marinobacter sp.]
MKEIDASASLELNVIVGAMHLSPRFGDTWRCIEEDGFKIDAKIDLLLSSNTGVGVAKSIGLGTIGMADALERLAPDVLVILGDRFEALAAAQAALVMGIPIAHLHGGELTEGAYDDAIRHAITKMSTLHFVAADDYRRRVIQLGESPETVFNVGAVGLDHVMRTPRYTLEELSENLGFALGRPFFLVTYHPVTAGMEPPAESFQSLLDALDSFTDHNIILTYPNADNGSESLISLLESFAERQPHRVLAIRSLGFRRYLSAVAKADAVIGNSSSGLIEVPGLGVPTVNIGQRQAGRLAADSVVHCDAEEASIRKAIEHALIPSFREHCANVSNPYGAGNAAGRIVKVLATQPLRIQKHFHDIR